MSRYWCKQMTEGIDKSRADAPPMKNSKYLVKMLQPAQDYRSGSVVERNGCSCKRLSSQHPTWWLTTACDSSYMG